MSELDLGAIEAEHVGEDCDCIPPCAAWCARCGDVWPCAAVRLVAAVRTLTAENERLRAAVKFQDTPEPKAPFERLLDAAGVKVEDLPPATWTTAAELSAMSIAAMEDRMKDAAEPNRGTKGTIYDLLSDDNFGDLS